MWVRQALTVTSCVQESRTVADVETPVLAPAVYLSITIEAGDGDEIHLHAGGQGVWVSRMIRKLNDQPVVCAPVGGESGRAFLALIADWDIRAAAVETVAETPAYVHDRRSGSRIELARSRRPTLRRHELDELYDRFLELALRAGHCVVTGPEGDEVSTVDLYRRLGADLNASSVDVIGDLHGSALDAFLKGGPLRVLKVSADDLVEDGILGQDQRQDDEVVDRICDELMARGAASVVVSRGDAPLLASTPQGRYQVTGPDLQPVGTEGSGDAMTGALASSVAQGLDIPTTLARAWAAGAANITRRGLGSGDAGLIDRLAERARVELRGDR